MERHEGDLRCVICGARRSQRERFAFDIDHLVPLEDGGPSDDWNTAPLCRDCHVIKGAVCSLRRHAEGMSARGAQAA
jgi:5-methylcytosine-specific restriction endonuclease McrA